MTYVKNDKGFRPFDQLFDDFVTTFPSVWSNIGKEETFALPPVNIYETLNTYEVELNVPGRKKEDFRISVENGLLTVSYEKKEEPKDEARKVIRREFGFRSFKRTFHLNEKFDINGITAKYENGMLILNLPKKAEKNSSGKNIIIE